MFSTRAHANTASQLCASGAAASALMTRQPTHAAGQQSVPNMIGHVLSINQPLNCWTVELVLNEPALTALSSHVRLCRCVSEKNGVTSDHQCQEHDGGLLTDLQRP